LLAPRAQALDVEVERIRVEVLHDEADDTDRAQVREERRVVRRALLTAVALTDQQSAAATASTAARRGAGTAAASAARGPARARACRSAGAGAARGAAATRAGCRPA